MLYDYKLFIVLESGSGITANRWSGDGCCDYRNRGSWNPTIAIPFGQSRVWDMGNETGIFRESLGRTGFSPLLVFSVRDKHIISVHPQKRARGQRVSDSIAAVEIVSLPLHAFTGGTRGAPGTGLLQHLVHILLDSSGGDVLPASPIQTNGGVRLLCQVRKFSALALSTLPWTIRSWAALPLDSIVAVGVPRPKIPSAFSCCLGYQRSPVGPRGGSVFLSCSSKPFASLQAVLHRRTWPNRVVQLFRYTSLRYSFYLRPPAAWLR